MTTQSNKVGVVSSYARLITSVDKYKCIHTRVYVHMYVGLYSTIH